jgi:hypothetical protein
MSKRLRRGKRLWHHESACAHDPKASLGAAIILVPPLENALPAVTADRTGERWQRKINHKN